MNNGLMLLGKDRGGHLFSNLIRINWESQSIEASTAVLKIKFKDSNPELSQIQFVI